MLPAISDCSLIKEDRVGEHVVRIPIPYRPGLRLGTAEAHHLNRKLAADVKAYLADWLASQPEAAGEQVDLAMFEFLKDYEFESPPPLLAEPEDRLVPVTIRFGAATLAELRRLKLTHGIGYNRVIRAAVEGLVEGLRADPDRVVAGLR